MGAHAQILLIFMQILRRPKLRLKPCATFSLSFILTDCRLCGAFWPGGRARYKQANPGEHVK
jgi:hypothetical protein